VAGHLGRPPPDAGPAKHNPPKHKKQRNPVVASSPLKPPTI